MTLAVTVKPHHPDCRYATGESKAEDPERCCYCAALLRQAYGSAKLNEDPLDYRYGGPGCWCA